MDGLKYSAVWLPPFNQSFNTQKPESFSYHHLPCGSNKNLCLEPAKVDNEIWWPQTTDIDFEGIYEDKEKQNDTTTQKLAPD